MNHIFLLHELPHGGKEGKFELPSFVITKMTVIRALIQDKNNNGCYMDCRSNEVKARNSYATWARLVPLIRVKKYNKRCYMDCRSNEVKARRIQAGPTI